MENNEEFEFESSIATDFTNATAGSYARVAPYGDAPQQDKDGKQVVQRFDRESAEKLVSDFKRNAKKLWTRLTFANPSIPFFNGHPDYANAESEFGRDNEIYAEAEDLEAREDGLWAKIKRGAKLDQLKEAMGRLEISPRWKCRKASDGTFKPFQLMSFGLVGRGNLAGADVINEKQTVTKNMEALKQLAEALELDTEKPTVEGLLGAIKALKKGKKTADEDTSRAKEEVAVAKKETAKAKEETDEANAEAQAKDKEIADLRNELADFLIKKAHADKKITPSQIEAYKASFAKDFVNARKELEALGESPEYSKGVDLDKVNEADDKERGSETSRQDAGEKLANMIAEDFKNARLTNPTASYLDAFQRVTSSKKGRELYFQSTSSNKD